jgi:PHD/YefM family antitoxin component YafN of YafNO toxin-antitoxin module
LLSSPKNAQHLMESIAQLKAGRIRTLELTDNETKRPQQTSS